MIKTTKNSFAKKNSDVFFHTAATLGRSENSTGFTREMCEDLSFKYR